MNGTRIDIRQVSVCYGKEAALRDVSLAIPDRQLTAIIGPSGCGKTTLLRCLNRLVDSTDGVRVSGEVWVDGDNILAPNANVTALRKKLGLISQKPAPLPMSIYDNVAYGPRLHGVRNKEELASIVRHSLETAGLWEEVKDRLRAPASWLSLGQQQRLCLARSLAVQPEVLLCDEPTSALDPESTVHIERKLIELKTEYTIVLVTHNLHQARRLADYVVFLCRGELIEQGPALAFFENAANSRTRSYVRDEIC